MSKVKVTVQYGGVTRDTFEAARAWVGYEPAPARDLAPRVVVVLFSETKIFEVRRYPGVIEDTDKSGGHSGTRRISVSIEPLEST